MFVIFKEEMRCFFWEWEDDLDNRDGGMRSVSSILCLFNAPSPVRDLMSDNNATCEGTAPRINNEATSTCECQKMKKVENEALAQNFKVAREKRRQLAHNCKTTRKDDHCTIFSLLFIIWVTALMK